MKKFSAMIYRIGINPVVDPPEAVLQTLFAAAGRSRGPIPVRGRLNGKRFTQTLIKYAGAWRLYINGQMLKDSGLAVGGMAEIAIEFDPEPREVPMPVRLAEALNRDAIARSAFEALSSSRRKDILRYLGSLKTPTALDRNINRVLEDLTGQE